MTIGSCPSPQVQEQVQLFRPPLGRMQPFGSPYIAKEDSIVGPNVRAQPVVSVTRSLGYDSSGHSHTLLMRDTPKRAREHEASAVSPRMRADRGMAALVSPRGPRMPLFLPPID